jgi:hypothetical protein
MPHVHYETKDFILQFLELSQSRKTFSVSINVVCIYSASGPISYHTEFSFNLAKVR